jgi:hypothetical protein
MHHHYIVVDDFYPNPDEIHFIANALETEDKSGGNYSGTMTSIAFYQSEHQQIFYHLTGQSLNPATQLNGKFRFSLASDDGKQHIHFDPGMNTQWAGVVYLQKPEHYSNDNEYGTYFWKHKRTGLTSIPLTQEGIEQYDWNNVDDLREFLETDGLDESLWEQTFYVPYKYNRLVLFRPWMFHSPGKNFGTTKENCRIIQTFFLG